MNLDGEAARRAFEPLAARFSLSVEQGIPLGGYGTLMPRYDVV